MMSPKSGRGPVPLSQKNLLAKSTMLEAIRKRSASFVVKLLFLLLVLSFGLWGIGDVISPNPQNDWAAKVGTVVIPQQTLLDEYQNELRRLQQVLGDTVDREQARALGLARHSLEQIVNRTLLDLGAADLGVVVSDDIIRQTVQTNPAFQNQQGRFDKQVFNLVIRNSGLTEAGYLESVRGDILRRQLVRNILAGAVAPRLLVDEIYRYRNEKRVISYVRIENKTMTQLDDANETVLREFYNENASLFSAPEYRSVTAIVLHPKDYTSEVAITDQDLETAFHDRSAEFNEPERRTLEQIIFKDEEGGQRAYSRIANGTDFAIVAKEEAGLDSDAIQLGTIDREQILSELVDVAFDLPEGGVSKPTKSPLGWHLIRVDSIYPAQRKSFDDVRDQLKEELAASKAVDALIELSNRLEDALGGGATLEEAASEIDTELLRIEALDRYGLNSGGEPVPDLPSGFADTAFSTDENSESSLIEADEDGSYFVVRVDKITPSAPKPFEMARKEVKAAWTAAERSEAAEATAHEVVRRTEQGTPLSELAAEYGLKVKTTSPVARSSEGVQEDLDMSLINSAFQAEPGKLFVVKGKNTSFVARIEKVIVADAASDPQRIVLTQDMENTVKDDLLSQLTQALTNDHPVEINNKAVEQLF